MDTYLKRVAVLSPSGNVTALVFDEPNGTSKKELNALIMEAWRKKFPNHPPIEQCGFLKKSETASVIGRIDMFGGEFCGNATRSAAWLLADGQNYTGYIEASGVEKALAFSIQDSRVTLQMPLPAYNPVQKISNNEYLVTLDGITHLVSLETAAVSLREKLQLILAENSFNSTNCPAFGVTHYDTNTQKAIFCIWVRDVDSIFDETACGSGTCAISIALATKSQHTISVPIWQPSGEAIEAQVTFENDHISSASIAGTVTTLYDGSLDLS